MTCVSVLIPTHARSAKLAACLSRLAQQSLEADRYEVLVGIDGHDDGARRAAEEAWRAGGGDARRLVVVQCPKSGQAAVRNTLLPAASGATLVFLNDDVLPAPDLLEVHLREQTSQRKRGELSLIVGAAPWRVHAPDRLFDRMLRETSMVFFYDQMTTDDPNRDWGFRHAWTLNLSAPADAVRTVGGFTVFPSTYGFEDDELAWRIVDRFAARVLYRPEASVEHDHRMDPSDYLDREERLGRSAWGFALTAPECARAMFRRDIACAQELERCRAFEEEWGTREAELTAWFASLADEPASSVGEGDDAKRALRALYEKHLPLKRLRWRRGLAAEAEAWRLRPTRGRDGASRSLVM